jgi:hypothetical protein
MASVEIIDIIESCLSLIGDEKLAREWRNISKNSLK